MQIDSNLSVFDSKKFSPEHPVSPEGHLFTYFPFYRPEALHYHDFLEIGYCEWGTGLFHVDGNAIPFCGPCCSIVYSGQIHIAQSISEEKSLWHFLYIDLKHLFSSTELPGISNLKAFSAHLFDFPSVLSRADDPELFHLCVSIMQEAAEMGEQYLTAIRGLTMALMTRHSRYMTPAKRVRQDRQRLLERLGVSLEYIGRHYDESLTIEQITEHCGVSKSTLQRDMLDFTGMAPLQYVHHLRMTHASILLASGTCPVAELAFAVGYNTLSSFNRHFLHTFGVSPSQWRKEHQQLSRQTEEQAAGHFE